MNEDAIINRLATLFGKYQKALTENDKYSSDLYKLMADAKMNGADFEAISHKI